MAIISKITGDTTGLKDAIQDAKKECGQLANGLKVQEFQKRFNDIVNAGKPMKTEIREITKMLSEMNLDGLSNTNLFTEAAERAGQLKDNIADASQAVKAFADDNMSLKSYAEGLGMIASTASVATGAMGLLGVENDNVTQAILKVQSAMAIMNGVQSIANALNKDSTLMLKMKQLRMKALSASTTANTAANVTNNVSTTAGTVATVANTGATVANTAATTIATGAKNALNMSIALGKALFGDYTGLILLGVTALGAYALSTSSAKNEQEKLNDETKKAADAQNDFNREVARNSANLVTKYKQLQAEWKNLRTEMEKSRFLKDRAEDILSVGGAFDDLVSAENFFVGNTENVIRALEARARQMALISRQAKVWEEYYDKLDNINNTVEGGGRYNVYTYKGPRSETSASMPARFKGLKEGVDYTVEDYGYSKKYTLTNTGIANIESKENKRRNAEALKRKRENERNALDEATKKFNQDQQEYERLADVISGTLDFGKPAKEPDAGGSGGGGKGDVEVDIFAKVDDGSLKLAQDKLKAFEDRKTKINVYDTEAIEECERQIEYWTAKVEDRKLTLGLTVPDGPLQKLDQEIKSITDKIKRLDPQVDTGEIERLNALLSDALKRKDDLETALGLKAVSEEKPTDQTTIGAEPRPEAYAYGSKWDKRDSYANAQSRFQQIQEDVRLNIIGLDEAQTEIDELNEKLKALKLEPLEFVVKDGQIVTAAERLDALNRGLDSVGNSFSTLSSAISGFSDANSDMTKGLLIAESIGQLTLAWAKALANHKSFTIWDWIGAAVGSLATLGGMVSTISRFETGGIVGGNSYSDGIIARVSTGEMILNKHQQASLFQMINAGARPAASVTGDVRFHLTGKELQGCLNNYNNATNRYR